MASTLLLNVNTWGLTLDANNNIAVATEPYSLAQDAASAIRTFLGEVYWDTTIGVPYMTQIFGLTPPLALLKQLLANAALSASPEIVTAVVYISSFFPSNRIITGQVQIVSTTGQVAAANFSTVSPQGVG
jgi:hypothetical protein